MGVKIVYETVDKTDPNAREQGRQAAREENARKVEEMEEELRQMKERELSSALEDVRLQNLNDAIARAEAKRIEAERKAERLREEKEQKERIASEKMKGELLNYEFGNKLLMATFEAQDLDVSDMKRVVIALFGPTGSGKTSFIGTAERTLLGSENQTAFDQGAGAEGTVVLQEFLSALKINLLDTRGFWNIEDNTLTECLDVMTGKTRESDVIVRNHDDDELGEAADFSARSMAKFGDQVHAVIFVIQAYDRRLKEGMYLERMKKIRDHFRFEGYSPITVITCEDKIKSDEQREVAFREASAATGSPIDRTFFITNYTSDNTDYSLNTEKQVLDILDTALLSAERFVKIQKLREVHHGSSAGAGSSSGAATSSETVKHFFKRLQTEYKWPDHKVTAITTKLEEDEITTVDVLKVSWDDLKKEIKMTIGIRQAVEKALADIN